MSDPAPLVVEVRRQTPHAVVIEACGELDLATCVQLRSALRRAIGIRTLVLDAAGISFCDIAGLRTLVEGRHLAAAAGCVFCLAAPSPAVARVLELTEAAAFFEIYPDVESAIKL